jgi:hypothetical protein
MLDTSVRLAISRNAPRQFALQPVTITESTRVLPVNIYRQLTRRRFHVHATMGLDGEGRNAMYSVHVQTTAVVITEDAIQHRVVVLQTAPIPTVAVVNAMLDMEASVAVHSSSNQRL